MPCARLRRRSFGQRTAGAARWGSSPARRRTPRGRCVRLRG
ncbi:hypothetical protein ACFPRL_29885 [Pseudoclavibacter helvolus]